MNILRSTGLMLAALSIILPAARADDWKAGVSRVVITPDEPMWMSGYGSRTKPAEGKLHDLWVKALALEDPAGTRAILLTADLVGISPPLSEEICGRIAARLSVGREAIQLATSHTHTGPVVGNNLVLMWDLPDDERTKIERYAQTLGDRMVRAAEDAVARLEPVRLAWGVGSAGFAVNRRNNPEPRVPELRAAGALRGPVDHDVPVLRVTAPDGTLRAVACGYACHNTVLSFYLWSGDYAGFAQLEIEQAHPGAVALFFAGCGADQNPLPRRTVELAQEYGRQLADSVEEVLRGETHPIVGRMAARLERIDLPFDRLPTADEIQAQAQSENGTERRRAALLAAQIRESGALRPAYPYPVQVWQLGPELTWVALGGEVVVDYSLRIKNELGKRSTWVAAYTNDVMAYIPSRRVLEEGGYEGGGAMLYYGLPTRWAPEVEELIVAKVHKLVRDARAAAGEP